jgi:hypothetical protein
MKREEPSLETLWLKNIRTMDKVQITDCSLMLIILNYIRRRPPDTHTHNTLALSNLIPTEDKEIQHNI